MAEEKMDGIKDVMNKKGVTVEQMAARDGWKEKDPE